MISFLIGIVCTWYGRKHLSSATRVASLCAFVFLMRYLYRRILFQNLITEQPQRSPPAPQKCRSSFVHFEDCDLHFDVRGEDATKPVLLFISGGLGDAAFWTYASDILCDEFTVISYDRRGNSRSAVQISSAAFSLAQQARDALAVLDAAIPNGSKRSRDVYVCGNSGGALITIELAMQHLQISNSTTNSSRWNFKAYIAHEAPLMSILPDARFWNAYIRFLHLTATYFSSNLSFLIFALLLSLPRKKAGKFSPVAEMRRAMANRHFLLQHEVLGLGCAKIDVEKLRRENPPLYLAVGSYSIENQLFYARPTPILAQRLGVPALIFPGNHVSFLDSPWEWCEVLRTQLHQQIASTKTQKSE